MTPAQRIANLLFPLDGFYAAEGRALPHIETVDGGDVPEPQRSLLVHERDMTSTLEAYFASRLHLQLLQVRQEDGILRREVVLRTDGDDRATEFGAIEIHLNRFEPEPRNLIVEGRLPVGMILREHAVTHRCRPSAFFVIDSEPVTTAALELAAPARLFGRHNEIFDADDQLLAEVVEILPPLE